jgi:hypothetical protein
VKDVIFGLVLTGLVTVLCWVVWDATAVQAAVTFGLLATAIHVAAVTLLKSGLEGSHQRLMGRWAMGMGLRLAGIVMFGVLVYTQRERYPPLPAAAGYIGVLIPLLFSEMRLLR